MRYKYIELVHAATVYFEPKTTLTSKDYAIEDGTGDYSLFITVKSPNKDFPHLISKANIKSAIELDKEEPKKLSLKIKSE
jgi:hypothetical protein